MLVSDKKKIFTVNNQNGLFADFCCPCFDAKLNFTQNGNLIGCPSRCCYDQAKLLSFF